MKKGALIGLLLFAVQFSNAQEWRYDIEAAISEAQLQNKKVLLFFSVPDACETCAALEQRVFNSPKFVAFADEKYILTKLEFRQTPGDHVSAELKAKNLLIVEKYNKDGFFPLVVVLTENRNVVGKIGAYNYETPTQYINLLKALESN